MLAIVHCKGGFRRGYVHNNAENKHQPTLAFAVHLLTCVSMASRTNTILVQCGIISLMRDKDISKLLISSRNRFNGTFAGIDTTLKFPAKARVIWANGDL